MPFGDEQGAQVKELADVEAGTDPVDEDPDVFGHED